MPVYELTGEQLDKAGIEVREGYDYFLSMPLGPGFQPFIYRSKPYDVVVEKELTFKEAFAL